MHRRHRGITLIELMVVLVVVGILAAIAYPSYREQVRRSNRTEAKVALEQTATALEKCFTRYMRYTSVAGDCPASVGAIAGFTTENGNYRVTGTIPRDAALTSPNYLLTATPQAGQADDASCGNFTIDERGTRGVSGTSDVAKCW